MFREAPKPKFGTTGVFDWNEAKKMQFAIFRNISDVYTKVDFIFTQKCNIREWNDSGSSKPEGHRQEVSKDEVRENVEESEEGEDVGGLHLNNKSHRAGESGGVASGQPSRQQQEQKLKNTKVQNTQISRAGDILASLAPITACMKDPTVIILKFDQKY